MPKVFGWLPNKERSLQTKQACARILREMPDWFPSGDDFGVSRACLWEVAKQGGIDVPVLDQQTGSCVGHGMETALNYLQALEIVRKKDPENYKLVFLPWHYGLGRLESGIRGRGEGSTGSGQVEAVAKYGIVAQDDDASLPKPQTRPDGSITWGSKAEMEWSDGKFCLQHQNLVSIGVTHLVRQRAKMNSAKDVKAWIGEGRGPVTLASDWGSDNPRVVEGRLLGKRNTVWNHQMMCPGWEEHPKLGDIYWIQNSWGDYGGRCPSGAPMGGQWVQAADLDYICRQDDSFGISDLDGFEDGSNIWFP